MCGDATPTAKLQTVVVRTKQNETCRLWSQRWSSGLFGNTTTRETLVRFCCCRCYEMAADYVISWGGWRSDVVSFLGRIPRCTWRDTRRCNHHCSLSSQPNSLSWASPRPDVEWWNSFLSQFSSQLWWKTGSHTTVFKGLTQKRTFGNGDMYDLTRHEAGTTKPDLSLAR